MMPPKQPMTAQKAVIVCLIGGMLGVVLAFGMGFIVSRIFASFLMMFSTPSIVAAIVVSSAVGLVFGFLPARNAAQLEPIEALARE
jgi:macrolide transport system ATP-binding/permease protein